MTRRILAPSVRGRGRTQVERLAEVMRAEERIVAILENASLAPTDVTSRLGEEFGDLVVREAIWRLIDEGRVELSPKRLLTLARVYAVA